MELHLSSFTYELYYAVEKFSYEEFRNLNADQLKDRMAKAFAERYANPYIETGDRKENKDKPLHANREIWGEEGSKVIAKYSGSDSDFYNSEFFSHNLNTFTLEESSWDFSKSNSTVHSLSLLEKDVLVMMSYYYDQCEWQPQTIGKSEKFEYKEIFPGYYIITNPIFENNTGQHSSGKAMNVL